MMEPIEIERRKPVWLALSDFYLDTELQPADFAHIRQVFTQSGYSRQVIEQINYEEVAPLLLDNLLTIAGVWGGFDQDWLFEIIEARLDRQGKRYRPGWMRWLWRKRVDYFTKDYMEQVFNESE